MIYATTFQDHGIRFILIYFNVNKVDIVLHSKRTNISYGNLNKTMRSKVEIYKAQNTWLEKGRGSLSVHILVYII
jgi:hypothetical protein